MNAKPNFDRIAKPYRWMEWLSFGPLLHRARTAWLEDLSHARSALVLGDGDGRFTRDLLAFNPQVHAHAVDLSAGMLAQLRLRCAPYADRVRTTHCDAMEFVPDTRYDLVTTHFFLDCLTQQQVEQLIRTLLPALTTDAMWLVSDFDIPQQGVARPVAAALVPSLYAAFRVMTGLRTRQVPDYATALQQAGFDLMQRREIFAGLILSSEYKRMRKA